MADISASAAKEHLLKGAGEIRVSKEAVEAAREAGHRFLADLGRRAGEAARAAGRKTIMAEDLRAAGAASAPESI